MQTKLDQLLAQIRKCSVCSEHLTFGPRPILAASTQSRILLAGQAPGMRVHKSGVPWNDPSGDRLRQWLGVSRDQFYDEHLFAIVPMGLCYPGKSKSGDLPPRKECAELYFDDLFKLMPHIKLSILIGNYAQNYHLGHSASRTLTETVKKWRAYLPGKIVLPHPSPRNVAWFKNNPWFEFELLPYLKKRINEEIK